eukprot:525634-Alexandrium_andersonii.AAC.1
MSASLVGSEMCIRDRGVRARGACSLLSSPRQTGPPAASALDSAPLAPTCLLYTSDAADDM